MVQRKSLAFKETMGCLQKADDTLIGLVLESIEKFKSWNAWISWLIPVHAWRQDIRKYTVAYQNWKA